MKTSSSKLTICATGSAQSSHIQNRVKCFAKRGHKVYLVTNRAVGIEGVTEIAPPEFPVRLINKVYRILYYFWTLCRCKADITHVHYARDILGWMAAISGNRPLVVSVMGGDILFEEQAPPTARSRWLTLQLLKRADLITAKSDYLIAVLENLGEFDKKTIKVVWGVDKTQFKPVDGNSLRQKLGLSLDDFVILSPRSLRPFYNIDLIVEAISQIQPSYPNIKLLLTEHAADSAYKAKITARIAELNLKDYVMFVGSITQENMPYYYSIADVVVSVPPSDGVPQSMFEAMACGVPCVLSRLSRYEEFVVHEESAILVDISPKAIAAGVIKLLDNQSLRDKIVQNGLQVVDAEANFDKEIDRVEQKYYDLLKTPHNWPGWTTRTHILFMIILFLIVDMFGAAVLSRMRKTGGHP